MRISLRGRVVLGFALTITPVIFFLVFTASELMVTNLRATIDESLEERTGIVAATIVDTPPSTEDEYARMVTHLAEQRFTGIPLLLRVANTEGRIVATYGDIPSALVPALDAQLRRPNVDIGRFDTVAVRGVEVLRTYTVEVHHPDTEQILALVQTAESLAPVEAAQGRLWRYALAQGVIGSMLAVAVGFLIIHRGLRPLDRVLAWIHDVNPQRLDVALPKEPRPPELQMLADSLNGMWERLRTGFQAQEAFMASMSHDLRTPLTALQGHIEVALMEPSLPPSVRDSLVRMADEVRRLIRMTNDLLLATKLKTNPPAMRNAVDLQELLGDVVADAWVLADGLDLSLAAPEKVTVIGDRDLLKQMTLNLLDNAIKFTPRAGRVEVRLQQRDGEASITVADSGRGIPPEHLARVTEPFYKADASRGPETGGVGLGLAIVKEIAAAHKGRVEVESREGEGTSVTIRLPSISYHEELG